MGHKTLIIKTGYSEVLIEGDHSQNVSLGDVLRTTAILHLFKNDEVTWVTDEKAFPLLENNPFIKRLLPYNLTTALQLQSEEFDTLINLEKTPGICALADKISAWRRYGFRFNKRTGTAEAYEKSFEVLSISSDFDLRKNITKSFQELLFEMIGFKWNNEPYIFGYKPKSQEVYDIGLNTNVGKKWPTKIWPKEYWDELESKLIQAGLKVTRQDKQDSKILTDLNAYADWINSCKLIVSPDTLGLHLSIALNKKIVGLFGPTSNKEVYLYWLGEILLPIPLPECISCFNSVCKKEKICMLDISPQRVYEKVTQIFKNTGGNTSL